MFAVIEARKKMQGKTVLDLFGGSGNLGFEALSRGAGRVLFVESHAQAVQHIRDTAELFGIADQVTVFNQPVEHFIKGKSQPYDLIFADPPYDIPFIGELVADIIKNNWLNENGWFILEHDKGHTFTDHPHCGFSKAYGRTIVSIFYAEPVSQE